MARPREYDTRVSTALRLPPELHDRLKRAADEREVSANLLIERAITEYLERLRPLRDVLATREA